MTKLPRRLMRLLSRILGRVRPRIIIHDAETMADVMRRHPEIEEEAQRELERRRAERSR